MLLSAYTTLRMARRLDIPSAIFAIVSVLYPLVAVLTVRAFGPNIAFVLLVVLIVARLVTPWLRGVSSSLIVAMAPVLFAVFAVGIFDRQLSVRLYPVFMNLALLGAFGLTLWQPPSMIERFARVLEPDFPPSGVHYTRVVTMIWVGFFAINGAIALWTVAEPGWVRWTLYNGLISYLAAGGLMLGEYIVRQFVRRAS
jgi:uncharacterized membrane protein